MVIFGKGALIIKGIGMAFTWLANNPIVILVIAIIFVLGLLWNMSEAMGGFWNMTKSVFNGVGRLAFMLGGWIMDGLVTVFERLLEIASAVGNFLGMDTQMLDDFIYKVDRQIFKNNSIGTCKKRKDVANQIFFICI
jgi:hypothetical protein